MRVQGSGSATFLLLLVLGVMAVVGVFGLPQFEPAVASPTVVEDHQWSDSIAAYDQAGAGEAVAQGVEDLFAPTAASAETTAVAADDLFAPLDLDRLEEQGADDPRIVDLISQPARPERDLVAAESPFATGSTQDKVAETEPAFREFPRNTTAQQTTDNGRANGQPAAQTEFDSRFGRQLSTTATTPGESNRRRRDNPLAPQRNNPQHDQLDTDTQPLTWRAAVARLNSLGIRKYHLTPGSAADEFHFSCFFSPANNPRLTHRFEAEANEPLQAVQKVLAQVDEWRGDR